MNRVSPALSISQLGDAARKLDMHTPSLDHVVPFA